MVQWSPFQWHAGKGHFDEPEWAIQREPPDTNRAVRMARVTHPMNGLLDAPQWTTSRLGIRDRVYGACLAAIRDGRLPAGCRLPSARQLAVDWHIARNTIDDALSSLHDDGLIVRLVGAGTFVASDVNVVPRTAARHRKPASVGKRALRMASARAAEAARPFAAASVPRPAPFAAGLAALDAFPLATWQRLAARCARTRGTALLGYLPASGYPPLQQAIADHLGGARAIHCAPEQVMIVNSAMQAHDLIARVLAERDDVGWIEDPGYPNLRAVLAMAGIRVVPIPVDSEGLATDRAPVGGAKPTLICVTPSCQHPTGAVMSLARRLALLELARRSQAWIVEDDHQAEFVWSVRPPAPLAALDHDGRTLYVGTFSHTIFPSLRIAYFIVPTALIDVFHAVRRQLDDHTHGFMQAVLADFIAGGHFSAHIRKMRALYGARRDALIDACARHAPNATLGGHASGMHATLAWHAAQLDTAIAARAAREGIRVLPLSRYTTGAARLNGLLLGYTALSERRIASAIARLAPVLGGIDSSRRVRR
jgi:GntR family transcriptional regulator/MocR family aminotransferase